MAASVNARIQKAVNAVEACRFATAEKVQTGPVSKKGDVHGLLGQARCLFFWWIFWKVEKQSILSSTATYSENCVEQFKTSGGGC